MTRRKSVCLKWTVVLLVVFVYPSVYTRPQDNSSLLDISTSTISDQTDKATENPIRNSSQTKIDKIHDNNTTATPATPDTPRNVKNKSPVIGESIKMVATQLLENHSNKTVETPVVTDTRIPPKLKNQLALKHKIKTRNENGNEPTENFHSGIAVPITMEELETENKISDVTNESSTSNEGISTWILLSNPMNKDNVTSTEPTKAEEPQKKKQNTSKNKTKRPQNNKLSTGKRPIIGSTNKSDLVAGGSAINENVYNKIKDTVLSNVQKNKHTSQKTTTVTTTTAVSSTEALTTKKETVTKPPSTVIPVIKVTSKPTKKKNKNKNKASTTTLAPIIKESALLPMEPKEQEIELEVSTPATTTKKPKRSSTRKKNKTKKRKTSKPKPETASVSEVKTSNKTKSTKNSKKPTSITGPLTSQIYNYFSREVMPSVGVGVVGLASLIGLAGYFLYPFATPVRRTFEVDKKDDIYRHNAEEYASEGNGQAEEEMLGTVLAGMPAHSKHKLNPYAGQTAHVNRYPAKKEQDLRYRHVATSYEPNYNAHYPQQKTGIAHGAVYSEPINYSPQQYENRRVYTTEGKYVYDKGPAAYTPKPAVEPIYAAPQTAPQETGPSGISSYGSDSSNSVVYGIKPSSDSDFKPVYPYEAQFYSETTSSPMTYPPTSMYLGSNNDPDEPEEHKYFDEVDPNGEAADNKFVVGNVPKELSDTATPAVVPEHGPRNLRKRRSYRRKRSIVGSIEDIIKAAKESNDIFLSNEIEYTLGHPVKNLAAIEEQAKIDETAMPEVKEVFPVYAVSVDPSKEDKTTTDAPTTIKTEVVESVSTFPIDGTTGVDLNKQEKTTMESDISNELEATTKPFRVYEVFSTNIPADGKESSPIVKENIPKIETTTQIKNMSTETTTELRSETTSTMPPSPSAVIVDEKDPISTTFSSVTTSKPTNNPEVLTYPPLNGGDGGFFSFLKRIVEFKYRLGLSILQTTSDNLNRYLRSIEGTVQKVANASRTKI